MEIPTLTEGKRGCGYRQPGGLYLVTDGEGEPCPKMPVELTICPTCGGGIKPTRGFTWIEAPGSLVGGFEPHGSERHSRRCPLSKGIDRAGLIWIGSQYYSPGSFLDEAARMGISRRIPAVPRDFEIGSTWVFFAHREASWKPCTVCGDEVRKDCETCGGCGYQPVAAIFYLAQPTRIEYVVKGDEDDEELERFVERGVTPVKVKPAEEQEALVTPS